MNFYIQAYKKGKDAKTAAAIRQTTCANEMQQKSKALELNNNNTITQDVLPLLSEKKVN